MSEKSNRFPKGIPFIIGNEAAERYSFYGMKAIFAVFLMNFITTASGDLAQFSEPQAKFWLHIFIMGTYGFSIMGAFISDIFWGKFKTIIVLSIVYIIGHFVLALFEDTTGFFIGCTLIAIGAGGIKPCVSAHVGDQFDSSNSHLIEKMYSWFYFSINVGAMVAFATAQPILENEYLQSIGLNSALAFGLPGLLMLIATIIFWLGRNKYISVPPAGWQLYSKELFSKKGWNLVLKLLPVYLFLAVFWSLFDQTGAAWVIQAESDLMAKNINLGFVDFNVFSSQLGVMNSVFILLFIPLFAYVVYPLLSKLIKLNYMNKIAIGFLLAALSFALIAWVQNRMDQGIVMNISWQILAYFLLTAGEVFVSVSSLEFSYTQAPNSMKSLILSFWLLAVALGNGFTALVNLFIEREDGSLVLEGAEYFWFFTGFMFLATIVFYMINRNFKEVHHYQNENYKE